MKILSKLYNWFMSLSPYYVILSQDDSSVTFSRFLFNHIRKRTQSTSVLMFRLSTGGFAFTVGPRDTPTATIQYSETYKTIGFETLSPLVSRIFYDYHISQDKYKLFVRPVILGDILYYEIKRPCKVY